jgi:hypothetical protein
MESGSFAIKLKRHGMTAGTWLRGKTYPQSSQLTDNLAAKTGNKVLAMLESLHADAHT